MSGENPEPERLVVPTATCLICHDDAAFIGRLQRSIGVRFDDGPVHLIPAVPLCKNCRLDFEIGDHATLVRRCNDAAEADLGPAANATADAAGREVIRAIVTTLDEHLWSWDDLEAVHART